MEEIFNLETYKKRLIEYYRWPCDEGKYEERKKVIDKLDVHDLENIIHNTKIFCFYLLEKLKRENQTYNGNIFTSVYIEEKDKHISNNCGGGSPCDVLWLPKNFLPDCWVSRYLLRKFFEGFSIDDDFEEIEEWNEEEQVGIILYYPKIEISGRIEIFNSLYERAINEKDIKRSLKPTSSC